MAKFYPELTDELQDFIRKQHVFFVASAPGGEGRVNVSPKGYRSLRIISPHRIAYLDFPGSGNETAHHVRERGDLTFMWCSFDEKPLILRVYCRAEVIGKEEARFSDLMQSLFSEFDAATARQIFWCEVESAQTSCGMGVPVMKYQQDRPAMMDWAKKTASQNRLEQYIADNAERNDRKYPIRPI